MRSIALCATLSFTSAMFCSCAGMMENIKAHNDRIKARQEAQLQAGGEGNGDAAGVVVEESTEKPAPGPHAPYPGKVRVAVFTTFGGELWQEGMQSRAEEMLRRDLAAHDQFELIPEARMQKLGKLRKPRMGSSDWVARVRDEFGKGGPQVLLQVTLTSEEAVGMNRKTGKVEKYPRFTAQTTYCHITSGASATYSKDGHVFANGNVMNDVIAEFHNRSLTEIMPAE